jgi:CPA2 family monovalent cation:H+ antiporter-2
MIVLAAAGSVPPFLTEIAVLLAVAAAVAFVCQRLGLVPIVGFLIAGVLIGPHALGWVENESVVEAAAEIGVLLLLFTIGIEFSLEKLARIRRLILVGGGLQVVLVTAAVAALLLAFGVSWRVGVFSGFLAALSSTAIVTKILGDRGQTGTPPGQAALGVLIFQDLAVIVMVLLVPALAGQGGSFLEVSWALGKAALIIALVLVFARRLLPPVLEAVARTCSPDLFLLTVIAICMGTAWLVGLAGVSVALGAFLAGLVVSESRHAEHALSEILPLQILFSATFFVSIGLLLDVGTLIAHLPLVCLVIAAVLAVKGAAGAFALRAAGTTLPVAAGTALMIAQVGEFSFVLERAGREVGLHPMGMGEAGSQVFIAVTVILMALTPFAAPWATRLGARPERTPAHDPEPRWSGDGPPPLADHVVVAGYGRAARALVRVLRGSRIPFVIATLSPDGAREAEREGFSVLRGDYGKRRILELLGVERAKLLVIPDDDPRGAHRVTAVARSLAPTTRILVRAATREDAAALETAGADRAIAAELEAIIGLFDDVLRSYRIDADQILAHEAALRHRSYDLFEPARSPSLPCELTGDCFSTRTLSVRAGMPLAGRRLADLGLADLGLRVVRIESGGDAHEPGDDMVLPAGAEVTFAGTTPAFLAAADLFRMRGPASLSDPLPSSPTAPPLIADWLDTSSPIAFTPSPSDCSHLAHIHEVVPSTPGCAECLASGTRWVHLRACLECGHVGCCDSSPERHATAHYRTTGHPVMCSLERGDSWGWCFVDEVQL